MNRTRGGLRLPHLVLLMTLVFNALPTVLTPRAVARVRDTVQMGDPTDDQSPPPGPTKNAGTIGVRTDTGNISARFAPATLERTTHKSLLEFLWSLQVRVIIVIQY